MTVGKLPDKQNKWIGNQRINDLMSVSIRVWVPCTEYKFLFLFQTVLWYEQLLQASTHVNFDKTDIRTADNEQMHHIAWLEIDRSHLLAYCLLFTVILKEMYITISTFYNVLTLVTFASIWHNSSCKFQEVTLCRVGICYENFWSFWWSTIAYSQQTKSLNNNYRHDISYNAQRKYRRGNDR